MNGLVESTLHINFDAVRLPSSFARLKELGIQQGYLTYDDILLFFPEAENNVDDLDQIFIAINDAGIVLVEEDTGKDASTEDSTDANEFDSGNKREEFKEDHLLSNVEPDNLIGLYFCEAAS